MALPFYIKYAPSEKKITTEKGKNAAKGAFLYKKGGRKGGRKIGLGKRRALPFLSRRPPAKNGQKNGARPRPARNGKSYESSFISPSLIQPFLRNSQVKSQPMTAGSTNIKSATPTPVTQPSMP